MKNDLATKRKAFVVLDICTALAQLVTNGFYLGRPSAVRISNSTGVPQKDRRPLREGVRHWFFQPVKIIRILLCPYRHRDWRCN